jgi:hypothetical protein
MIAERTTCMVRFAERSAGLNAKGQSGAALKAMWQTKRSQVACTTGMASTVTRYFAVASRKAKQTVASTISPMALEALARVSDGGRR